MKGIKINELKLRNFKGIKDFTLSPEGSDVNIYGDNATGKTTIMDAFIWLMFNKDSQNSSNFNVKTLDEEGNVIHGLEHEVSAKLEIDSTEIELQKIYKENWVKKRGQAESELSGHTTDYFINGVPKKKSEYTNYLSQIIDEDTFKILTNPLFFNTSLNWKDRRKIALEICNEISDEDIFMKEPTLKGLETLLENKSIDDVKAEMTAKRKKLNEELKSIPYRIDELSREDLKVDTKALMEEKKALEGKLNSLKNSKNTDYDFKLRSINASNRILQNQIKELEIVLTQEIREELNSERKSKSNIEKSYYELQSKVVKLKDTEINIQDRIRQLQEETESLRDKFKSINSTQFKEDSTICPTCNQSLPVEKIEKLVEEFESNKTRTLQQINELGKSNNKLLKEHKENLNTTQIELKQLSEEFETIKIMLNGKKQAIEDITDKLAGIDITKTSEFREIEDSIVKLAKEKLEIEKLSKDQDNSEEIKKLEKQVSAIDKDLAKIDIAKDNEKRVKELMLRERELAQMVADTEQIEFLCDEYIITKANLLEDNLNSRFKLVKFKLFDVQVNGGINETFVTTVNGVPFEDLNNAMRINAGLDIITTLSKQYDFKAPIFLDNRESVNKIPDMDAQIINLIVSKHKSLRVEVE